MSGIFTYLSEAMQGVERYFQANKLIVLLIAVLLVFWLANKKVVGEKGNRMLVYTAVMCVLLICPVTAVAVMIYQTRFYDYEWAWGLISVTAVIAYGAVVILDKYFEKRKLFWGVVIAVAILALCGNQGMLRTVDAVEARSRTDVQEILQCIQKESSISQKVLWAPKNIMQEVRRQDGKILLIYGRDMWDEKAGAYDYEAYDESLIQAYIWLENMAEQERLVSDAPEAAESFADLCEELDKEVESYLWIMVEAGVNTFVLPNLTADYMEEALRFIASQRLLTIETAYTEEYTIYFLE